MPKWVSTGFQEYAKRLSASINLELIEIPLPKRAKHTDIKPLMEREGKRMLAQITANDHVIALDVLGKQWNTQELAKQLQHWRELARDICLLIGGPEGLAQSCLEKADEQWSLSKLTLPHPLVRVLLAEQLYRAWSIICGHPYHR